MLPRYSSDGSSWLRTVQDLCTWHRFNFLVPTSDSSLAQLLRHAGDFEGIGIAIPNGEAAATFTDKILTRELARSVGVPTAKGGPVELVQGKWKLKADIELPMVLKRRQPYQCGEDDQKADVLLIGSERDLQRGISSGRYDLGEALIPGFCRGISILARRGEVLVAHQHRRLRQKHATGPSSSRISEHCELQLLEWTARLAKATMLTGVAMFEYRHDPASGETVLLEVNPRFWGSLPLALASGADFPALWLDMLMEQRDPPRIIGSRPGVLKLNLNYEFYALAASIGAARNFGDYMRVAARMAQFAARLLGGRLFDSWAPDDRAPYYAERRQVMASVSAKLLSRLKRLSPPRLEAAE